MSLKGALYTHAINARAVLLFDSGSIRFYLANGRCGASSCLRVCIVLVPCVRTNELPISVQRHRPEHGQEIYREAFNYAWQEYSDDPRREEIAHRVA